MLVLSRKCNEQIVIGDGIVVTIVSIRGGSVRVGIEAPSSVGVHRQEVYQAIRSQAHGHDTPRSHRVSEGTSPDTPETA
jgi:carbon storage regulator